MKIAIMKNATFLFICLIACVITSCRKDQVQNSEAKVNVVTPPITDSVSFTLDGKFYSFNEINSTGAGNREANKKVIPWVADGRGFTADQDTLLYSSQVALQGNGALITFHFAKKYAKADMKYNNGLLGVGILSPVDKSTLFAAGNYSYPLGFDRDNTQNGIAIALMTKGEGLTSYDTSFFGRQNILGPNSQDNSIFKIISLKKLSNRAYLLEAKFNVNLFAGDNNARPLTNGYLRVTLD